MNATNNFKPILFSTEMVQAILAGRKTQTRRVTVDWDQHKPKFIISSQGMYGDKYPKPSKYMAHFRYPESKTDSVGLVAPIQPGDILWVRETWQTSYNENSKKWDPIYKADGKFWMDDDGPMKWKPSLFMQKKHCRIFLKVTNVRCERLQDISEEDAISEGAKDSLNRDDMKLLSNLDWVIKRPFGNHQFGFLALWQSINGKKYPWESNPWVWVYDFEKIEKPENFLS